MAGVKWRFATICKSLTWGFVIAKSPFREFGTSHLGLRWTIERTNSWLSNYGQLRRNTDRQPHHRRAQLALAITCILTAKLIDHRDRWNPKP